MKRPEPACRTCTKRHADCHSDCEEYLQFKTELEGYKNDLNKNSDLYLTNKSVSSAYRKAARVALDRRNYYASKREED